jgi:hypothetical protein
MAFKTCPMCQDQWDTREDFLECLNIDMLGYQARFDNPEEGIFLFNHKKIGCGSTLSIQVGKLTDLYKGPRYPDPKTGTVDCSGKCVHMDDLERCEVKCAFAYIREIIQVIRGMHCQFENAKSQK